MSIDEVKMERVKAELSIKKILHELNKCTGLKIESVDIDIIHTQSNEFVFQYSTVKIRILL